MRGCFRRESGASGAGHTFRTTGHRFHAATWSFTPFHRGPARGTNVAVRPDMRSFRSSCRVAALLLSFFCGMHGASAQSEPRATDAFEGRLGVGFGTITMSDVVFEGHGTLKDGG